MLRLLRYFSPGSPEIIAQRWGETRSQDFIFASLRLTVPKQALEGLAFHLVSGTDVTLTRHTACKKMAVPH